MPKDAPDPFKQSNDTDLRRGYENYLIKKHKTKL